MLDMTPANLDPELMAHLKFLMQVISRASSPRRLLSIETLRYNFPRAALN